jgi:hypothetical protein
MRNERLSDDDLDARFLPRDALPSSRRALAIAVLGSARD